MEKIYVITGATSGIGKALVKYFSKDNKVFAGFRNRKYENELKEIGAIPFYIDMENENSIADAAGFIMSQTNKVDTLINVAGCVVAGAIEMLPVKDIKNSLI